MSTADARRAGIVPPEGWEPPRRDRAIDAVRTVRVVAGMLVAMTRGRGIGGDTLHVDGLARIQADVSERLRRLRVRVEVRHAERVPREGGVVFMWNQTSHLDHLVLPLAIPRPFFSLYNNEVRRIPIYGDYLARTDHVWVDRTDETQWRAQIARAAERVAGGEAVVISPEGTRSWDGRLLPMKRGAFLLARSAGVPIVCATVYGARELLPRGRFAIRPGTVVIELSSPIASAVPDLEAAVARTFESTLAALREARG